VSLLQFTGCSIAALQVAKVAIIFHIGVIRNVNFAKKEIIHPNSPLTIETNAIHTPQLQQPIYLNSLKASTCNYKKKTNNTIKQNFIPLGISIFVLIVLFSLYV